MSRRVVLMPLDYVGSRQLFPMQETGRRQGAELEPDVWWSRLTGVLVFGQEHGCRIDCRQRLASAARWSHIISSSIRMFCIVCVMLMCTVGQQW
jgi:hypothetical protein